MKKKTLIFISIITITIISFFAFDLIKNNIYASPKGQLSYKEKKEDAKYLLTFLEENYPFFDLKKRTTGYDFLKHKKEYINKIAKTKNDEEFFLNVYETMKLLQNDHSRISYSPNISSYNEDSKKGGCFVGIINDEAVSKSKYWNDILFNMLQFPDIKCEYINGEYIVVSSSNNDIHIGDIITKVNDTSIENYIKNNMNQYSLSYDFKRKIFYTDSLLLECSLDKDDVINVTVMNKDKTTKDANVHFSKRNLQELVKFYNKSSTAVVSQIIEENNIAYLKINSMSSDKSDFDKVNKFFKDIKDYKNVIIDIRGNGGGSDTMSQVIIKNINADDSIKLRQYFCYRKSDFMNKVMQNYNFKPMDNYSNFKNISIDQFNIIDGTEILPYTVVYDRESFKKNVYILTDGKVYSSAEIFANNIKMSNLGTIIGTTTKGDGLGTSPVINTLPNSKLCIQITSCIGIDSEGNINEEVHTSPDYYMEQSVNDYQKALELNITDIECSKYDTVFNKCINIIKSNTFTVK